MNSQLCLLLIRLVNLGEEESKFNLISNSENSGPLNTLKKSHLHKTQDTTKKNYCAFHICPDPKVKEKWLVEYFYCSGLLYDKLTGQAVL